MTLVCDKNWEWLEAHDVFCITRDMAPFSLQSCRPYKFVKMRSSSFNLFYGLTASWYTSLTFNPPYVDLKRLRVSSVMANNQVYHSKCESWYRKIR